MNRSILVITELFLPTKGGTAVWFDEVYRRLGGKEIVIITSRVPGSNEHDENHPNKIIRLNLRRYQWVKPESLIMYIKLFILSLLTCYKNRIKEVHCGRVLPEGLVGLIVAKLTGGRLMIYAHGEEITTWVQPMKQKVMRYVYINSDILIANSEFTKDKLIKLGVSESNIRRISPGVDTKRFDKQRSTEILRNKLKIPKTSNILLSVGRLSRRKGFDMVIRSLKPLMKNGLDPYYVIIGIGEDKNYLEQVARDEGVHDRVFLLGHVSMGDLPKWYNECDIYIMPNRNIDGDEEGFGMVYIEAAACGKAAIAGKTGGTGSSVIDGVTGLRVDGSSSEDVVNAITRLLRDDDFRVHLENNAYNRVQREFSWEKVAEQTKQVMKDGDLM